VRRRRYEYSRWSDHVPAAERRRNAARVTNRLAGDGRELAPVRIAARGNKIAHTFWGSSWCQNLERYSDYANRLPRGRTYARNGSVIDLQITPGKVTALVSGSEVYEVEVAVTPLPKARWQKLCADCADDIDSLVELLQGRFSAGIMEVLCRSNTGIFPEPKQIEMTCSCPDWATMCKHVAAVLYGVGARLDSEPELLFTLRQVDCIDLVSARDGGIAAATAGAAAEELAGEDLGAIFGIELAAVTPPKKQRRAKKVAAAVTAKPAKATKSKTTKAKAVAKPQAEAETKAKRSTASKRRSAAAPDPWITAVELRQRGVPNHVVQAWLNKGLVTHSGERGIYVRTPAVEELVGQYLTSSRTRGNR
jgi:uncharacterized Zn finger protein